MRPQFVLCTTRVNKSGQSTLGTLHICWLIWIFTIISILQMIKLSISDLLTSTFCWSSDFSSVLLFLHPTAASIEIAITKIDNFFIFNKISYTFEKYSACKNTFFFAISKKSSTFAADFAEGKAPKTNWKTTNGKVLEWLKRPAWKASKR